jgi:glycosyltransferase involved in cell wall biosynthesis
MNILIFNQYFWPENFRINEIALALKARGHKIEVLTGKPNYPQGKVYSGYKAWGVSKELWHNISIYRIPIFPRGMKSSLRLAINYLSFIIFGIFIAPLLLRKKKYDVIFVCGLSPIFQVIPASFLGWLKGVPVVLWVQDLWPQSASATGYVKSGIVLKLLEKLVKFSYTHTDLILVQSEAFLAPVKKLVPDKPIVYYPNSVDDSFYSPAKDKAPVIDSLKSGFVVMFAGNIGEAQAMETIIDAATQLSDYPEIKIVILGSGSKLDWLKMQITQNSLKNVHLEGSFSSDTMPTLMRQASALMVTLNDQPICALTVPNKIQAYLAVGKPIIACLNGEGAKVVSNAAAGFSVPAGDSNSLAKAIVSLYQMSDAERAKMGENGRAYFKRYFDERMLVDQLIGHLENTIHHKGTS